MMRIKVLVLLGVLGLQSTHLWAGVNHISAVSFTKVAGEYQCRLLSNKKVPFGSIWLPGARRLVIYVRESKWTGEKNVITPAEGPVEKISIGPSPTDNHVVEVYIDFREIRKQIIDYDGMDIVAYIEGEQPLQRKSVQVAAASKIERLPVQFSNSKISMDYREADLPNVLRLLSKQNDINIVAGPDVKGTITISLRNVTLQEALDNILRVNGYDYIMDNDMIIVRSKENYLPGFFETKIYRLKYVDAENVKQVLKELLPEDVKMQVFSPEFYSVIKDEKAKNTTQAEGVRQRSSTLIVTASPDILEEVNELISQLDVATPQIVIESKLVELAPVDNTKLGIDWDKTLSATLMGENLLSSGETQTFSVMNDNLKGHASWKLGRLTASQFSTVLNFLQEKTDTKLISNPRVMATDNVTSTISVGTTFPIPQINRGLAGQGDIVTFSYKDVNIQLNVTPHVVNNDEIIMYVNPVIEEVTGEVVVDVNRAPITSKRTVNTVVTVKDGETIVIGGMIKEDRKKKTSKVFLLGDIPLIGNLFRHTTQERQQKDLVIFITPHILK